ncbi:MAG TPA: Ig-like domain-containing protein [Gemmataceae bacterium]|nr:Ig-like domain-containing protein [Gemmataceae bacterium]
MSSRSWGEMLRPSVLPAGGRIKEIIVIPKGVLAGFSSGNFSTLALVGAIGSSPNGNENFAGLAFVPGYHTLITLGSSNDPAAIGDPVTLIATVTAPNGMPTGVVSVYDGTTLLGLGFYRWKRCRQHHD